MKKIRRKVNKPLLYFVFFVFASVTVGYAALSTTLSITGKGTLSKNSWDIHFENLVIVDNGASVVTTAPTIDSTKTKVSFNITLSKPGDSYEFTVDAVNKGTIDAMLSGFSATSLTADQQKYLTYTVTYGDGATISTKDYLKKGTSETIRVRVKFRDDLSATDLPSSAETLNLIATLVYVQADSTANERTTKFLCKRATSLHTATFTSYNDEGSIGNLGTSGNIPVLGDAFDCDVNGDGNYDSATERFYYLTGLDSDDEVGIFLYYNLVAYRQAHGPFVAYGANASMGPTTARTALPTADIWPNVSLISSTKQITDIDDNVKISNFSYSGYVARIPTYQELAVTCFRGNTGSPFNSGSLYACKRILAENTYITNSNIPQTLNLLLENVGGPYGISLSGMAVTSSPPSTGLKPVIEVPEERISY